MTPMIEKCEQVQVIRLGLLFIAPHDTYLPSNVAAKFRGAVKERLDRLAQSVADPQRRAALQHARRTTDSLPRTQVPGLEYVPFALDVPWTAAPIGPETTFACELLLLEDAAELWPAWLEALEQFQLGDLPLHLAHACLLAPGQTLDIEDAWENPWGVQMPLSDHLPPGEGAYRRVRVHLLTPTCWNKPENFDPAAELSVPHFVGGVFRRLSLIANQKPSPEEAHLRDAELPGQVRIGGNRALVVVRTSRPSPSRRASRKPGPQPEADVERMEYGGMMGFFDLEGTRDRPIPDVLIRALRIVEIAHLGASIGFGCGRLAIEPLE